MDVHIEVYTITAGRPCTCVLISFEIFVFFCYFQGSNLKEDGDTNNYYYYSTKDGVKSFFMDLKRQLVHASQIL